MRLHGRARLATAAVLALLPARAKPWAYRRVLGYDIDATARIGFSVIDADDVHIGKNVTIGNGNLVVRVGRLSIGEHSRYRLAQCDPRRRRGAAGSVRRHVAPQRTDVDPRAGARQRRGAATAHWRRQRDHGRPPSRLHRSCRARSARDRRRSRFLVVDAQSSTHRADRHRGPHVSRLGVSLGPRVPSAGTHDRRARLGRLWHLRSVRDVDRWQPGVGCSPVGR